MKILFWLGLVLLVCGLLSLVVPIPHSERQGFSAGDMHVGIQTQHSERVAPMVSAVLILAGAGMVVAAKISKR